MCARLILKKRKYDNISPALRDLHWLKIKQRIDYSYCVLGFKVMHGLGPDYLASLLRWYRPTKTLRSMEKHLLEEKQCRTRTYGERSFSVQAPRKWNSLPYAIRQLTEVEEFKKHLKTFLFKQCY